MMLLKILIVGLACVGLAAILSVIVTALRQSSRADQTEKAREMFSQRREWLEADFLTQAKASGKPRGLDWVNCDFEDEVQFARDRSNGQLRALVGVTISFEAIPGGGMEDVEAVGNLRCATAVFRFAEQKWITDGRAIFNLRPEEAIVHFKHELERV